MFVFEKSVFVRANRLSIKFPVGTLLLLIMVDTLYSFNQIDPLSALVITKIKVVELGTVPETTFT